MSEPLCVVLYTHIRRAERLQYAQRALASVNDHLHYDGPMLLHISDDASDHDHFLTLSRAAQRLKSFDSVTTSHAGGRGYGGSYNLSCQTTHAVAGVLLPLEDDWELLHDWDATPYVGDLLSLNAPFGAIRLGYLGWTEKLVGHFTCGPASGTPYLLLDPASPERHVFAGHPRLETRAYQRQVGKWPVDMDAGTTEFEVAGRDEARRGIAWPMTIPPHSLWAHIGTVQAREDQR